MSERAVRVLKRLVRRAFPVKIKYPDWSWLQKELSSKNISTENQPQRILIANIGGHAESASMESMLAAALNLRGAQTDVLLCDEVLPACERCGIDWMLSAASFVRNGPRKDSCPTCFAPAFEMFQTLGLTIHRYGQLLDADDIRNAEQVSASIPVEEVGDYTLDGIPVGEHAWAGALRFFARGDLREERYGEAVLRRYLRASLLTATALSRLFDNTKYDCVIAHHGIYVPQGIVGAVARSKGVRVVNWTIAYKKRCFIFSHDDTYHHTMMEEPVSNWENMAWTAEMEEELIDYLKSRWDGSRDWISFNRKPESDLKAIGQELGIDFSRPSVGLLTNVIWDAQLHYPSNVFGNMIEWLIETIRYFSERPDLQLIVRIHPAEVNGAIKSRQLALEEIERAFPTLPKNIFIIPPTSSISTYPVMLQCNAVLIYGTKTGVELTSMGVPVIVAGEAWIRNKGVTTDATSVAEYKGLLDSLPLAGRLDDERIRRARMYAYHFFFRRMIPLEYVVQAAWPRYNIQIDSLEDLRPGKSVGLDVICDGIMRGTEFIYPAESYSGNESVESSSSRLEPATV
jgi:hypothetical protein